MALYDSGVTYDSGILYDEAAPSPNQKKKMAKVKLNLKDKTDSELVTFAQQHITAMTGNVNYTTLVPAAPAFLTITNAFNTALGESVTAQQTAKQKTAAKDAARLALEAALTQRGSYVELTSAGDEPKILSSGFDVKGAVAPIGTLTQVLNLALTAGDADGEVDATWDAVRGAKSYEIQISADPITATSWQNRPSITKSRVNLTGLTTGTRVWVRVRAVGAAGAGPWSDPATKIVP